MAKRGNYGFEKRQRELEKRKKKEQKKADRLKAAKEPSPAKSDDGPDQRPPESH